MNNSYGFQDAVPTAVQDGGEDPGDQKPLVSSEHGSSSDDGEELEADDVGKLCHSSRKV